MAKVSVRGEPVDLDDPVLVEGLPGVGLVGKIATDHLIDEFDMRFHAAVECDSLPAIARYDGDERGVLPPVRIYVDETRDLLALQSDVPVSRVATDGFTDCVTSWLDDVGARAFLSSGMPAEQDPGDVPAIFGVATGDVGADLDDHGIEKPPESGVIGGPTGALLNRAESRGFDAACFVVETDPRFPDPAGANRLLTGAIGPLAGIDVPTDDLVDRAEEIRSQREKLAERMRAADEEESSQAKPLRMFQ